MEEISFVVYNIFYKGIFIPTNNQSNIQIYKYRYEHCINFLASKQSQMKIQKLYHRNLIFIRVDIWNNFIYDELAEKRISANSNGDNQNSPSLISGFTSRQFNVW
jgi:hypothetical protein